MCLLSGCGKKEPRRRRCDFMEALYGVNNSRYARLNPVCDENALDINMDQSGSTSENSLPTPVE